MSITTLKRLVGIQFEFKRELQSFFTTTLANKLVLDYDSAPNTPSARNGLKTSFALCGPAMGFEAKKFAYGTLELIVDALVNNPDVPTAPYENNLNDQLVNITRYVGIAGEEDFHFMVAVYNLCATINNILENVTPVGPILTLTLAGGGTGHTTNGTTSSATNVVFKVTLAPGDQTDPAQYAVGSIRATIASGVITTITQLVSGGGGFAAGDVVTLEIDTAAAGQSGATFATRGTATVATVG